MPVAFKSSGLTATGDTTRTTVGTVTMPANAKRILGLMVYACAAAAITSGESVSGIAEFVFSGLSNSPPDFSVPLDVIQVLTSGAVDLTPRIWAVDYAPAASVVIECFITMDMAQTGGLKARFTVAYEY